MKEKYFRFFKYAILYDEKDVTIFELESPHKTNNSGFIFSNKLVYNLKIISENGVETINYEKPTTKNLTDEEIYEYSTISNFDRTCYISNDALLKLNLEPESIRFLKRYILKQKDLCVRKKYNYSLLKRIFKNDYSYKLERVYKLRDSVKFYYLPEIDKTKNIEYKFINKTFNIRCLTNKENKND